MDCVRHSGGIHSARQRWWYLGERGIPVVIGPSQLADSFADLSVDASNEGFDPTDDGVFAYLGHLLQVAVKSWPSASALEYRTDTWRDFVSVDEPPLGTGIRWSPNRE